MTQPIRVDLSQYLTAREALLKGAPRAVAGAINRTLEEVLKETREVITRTMIVRNARFTLPPQQLPRAWRADAATKKLWAEVALGNDDGRASIGGRRAQILGKFGRPHQATAGRLPLAIPQRTLRRTGREVIPKRLFPRNLLGTFNDLGEFTGLARRSPRRARRARQRQQAFVLGGPSDRWWGVYVRAGGELVPLWLFRQTAHVPGLLPFEPIARRTIDQRVAINLRGTIDVEIARLARRGRA